MALSVKTVLSFQSVLNWNETLLGIVAAEKLWVLLKTFRMASRGRVENNGEDFALAGRC